MAGWLEFVLRIPVPALVPAFVFVFVFALPEPVGDGDGLPEPESDGDGDTEGDDDCDGLDDGDVGEVVGVWDGWTELGGELGDVDCDGEGLAVGDTLEGVQFSEEVAPG